MRLWSSIIIISALLSTEAYARRERRDGFNFGTSVRLLDDTRTIHTDSASVERNSSTYAVNPFLGYAFSGLFNLGLSATAESTSTLDKTKYPDDSTSTSDSRSTLTGGSLFGRLLFGSVMFMEANAGVYRGRTRTVTSKMSGGETFSGSSDSTTLTGVGYGYGFALGLEVPMGDGFFVTGAYTTRHLFLKDYEDTSKDIRQDNLKSELQFGIAHYLR